MEMRPGYKQTEVGVIPEDWLTPELQRITADDSPICYGIVQVGPFTPNGIPVLAIKNLNLDYSSNIHRASTEVERPYARSRIRPEDVVVSVKGTTGRVGLVPRHFRGNISRDLARIRPRAEIAPRFIYQILQSEPAQRRLVSVAVGTTRMELSIAILKQVCVPLPPTKAEQEAIAEVLSDADALIESLEQLLVKKRQLKQSAMQELLTGRKRLPGFSREWEVTPLGALFNFSGGFTASRDQLSSEGFCYLHYGDIHASKKSFIDVHAEYQDMPKLDVPLTRISPVSLLDNGDVVFVDASEDDEGASRHLVIINPGGIPLISGLHTIVAKSKTDALDHQYRRYCFHTPEVKAQFRFFAVGTKVSGISKTNIARITVSVPSVAEQSVIAAILSAMDAEIASLEARLAKAQSIKQGMMHELLTGRIRLV